MLVHDSSDYLLEVKTLLCNIFFRHDTVSLMIEFYCDDTLPTCGGNQNGAD